MKANNSKYHLFVCSYKKVTVKIEIDNSQYENLFCDQYWHKTHLQGLSLSNNWEVEIVKAQQRPFWCDLFSIWDIFIIEAMQPFFS